MDKIYTGIGSRKAPASILDSISSYSKFLSDQRYCLRSGGAGGCDLAFENSHSGTKLIYLPKKGFNGSDSDLYLLDGYQDSPAYEIACKYYHSNLTKQSDSVKRFMTRNVFQVLGLTLDTPSDFIICWTSDGKASGGTGQALRIAADYGVNVYNLFNENDVFWLNERIDYNA